MKRSCQRHTQVFDLPVCRIIAAVPAPSPRQQNDRCPPDVLLGGIAIPDHALKAKAVWRRNFKYDPGAHDAESHGAIRKGIPDRTLVLGVIH